jgi:hypothetical protein
MLYIPFRSGRNGRKISYRHANRYEAPPCSTSAKISACFGRITYTGRNTFLAFYFLFFFSASSSSASASASSAASASASSSFSASASSASSSASALLLLLLLLCFFFRPALSLFLYLWWIARRTAITLQLAMKNQRSFQSTFNQLVTLMLPLFKWVAKF